MARDSEPGNPISGASVASSRPAHPRAGTGRTRWVLRYGRGRARQSLSPPGYLAAACLTATFLSHYFGAATVAGCAIWISYQIFTLRTDSKTTKAVGIAVHQNSSL